MDADRILNTEVAEYTEGDCADICGPLKNSAGRHCEQKARCSVFLLATRRPKRRAAFAAQFFIAAHLREFVFICGLNWFESVIIRVQKSISTYKCSSVVKSAFVVAPQVYLWGFLGIWRLVFAIFSIGSAEACATQLK
jgi:hypothetical protein